MNAADAAVVDAWWRTFVATGRLPADLPTVQARWIRAVHRGALPSGPVFVKVMTFPRPKDRLRYLLRPLPGQHEAALLAAATAAGIPCPRVVAVRAARRWLLPHRSLLVLAALPVVDGGEDALVRLRDEAALALHLLHAGIVHRDLHGGNFVRLADGRLAVLDLQSASRVAPARIGVERRVAAAARLWQEHLALPAAAVAAALQAGGLVRGEPEWRRAQERARSHLAHWLRARIRRCWQSSTEFVRRLHWWGVEYRRRGPAPEGRWVRGGRRLGSCWLGDRAAEVLAGQQPAFFALQQTWWWLGGGCRLYVRAGAGDTESALRVAGAWALRLPAVAAADAVLPTGAVDMQRTEAP